MKPGVRALPAALPLVVLLAACGDPTTFALRSAEATVDVTVEPFSFVVKAPDGAALARGAVDEVHVAGEAAASSTVRFDALSLSAAGGPARRVRWHVLRLR